MSKALIVGKNTENDREKDKPELITEKSQRERLEEKEKLSNFFLIFQSITSSLFIDSHHG